jgi:phosphinothricin acetyltransferase
MRVAQPSDAAAVRAIYAPYVADTAISFELDPPSVEEMARRIEAVRRRYPWLVYELDGEVVGYAYATAHRERAAYGWSADGAVYLSPQAHRRGIGRALYQRLAAILNL